MLETPDMISLLEKGSSVRMTGIGTISREGYSVNELHDTPSETATPALCCYKTNIINKDEDTVHLTERLEPVRPIYWVDQKFPNPLKTEEQNYWLGFLMCDGYIQGSPGQYSLALELAVKDAYAVSRFASFIGRKAKSSRNRVRVLRACTKELHKLAKHGIVKNKTGKEIWPDTVTCKWAFIRGILDGDGSVSVSNDRALALTFYSQSKKFLQQIAIQLFCITLCEPTIGKIKEKKCYRISYSLGHAKANKLYKLLYSSDPREPRLHRKERVIRIFCQRPKPKIGRPSSS